MQTDGHSDGNSSESHLLGEPATCSPAVRPPCRVAGSASTTAAAASLFPGEVQNLSAGSTTFFVDLRVAPIPERVEQHAVAETA